MRGMNDFVYGEHDHVAFLGEYKPVRSAVDVGRLPRHVLVEIDAIPAV